MEWYITLYIMFTFFTTAIITLLAVYAWRHRQAPGASAFALLLVLVIEWSLCGVLQVLSPNEAVWNFWGDLKYIGLAGVPPLLLIFALQYTEQRRWVVRRLWWLFVIPLVTQIVIWTNPGHHFWLSPGIRGPWFWVHTAYSFILVFIGLTLMSLTVLRASAARQGQTVLLVLGFVFPLIVNVLHTFGIIPYIVDLTPIAFTGTSLAFAWTLYHHRLFDLTPLARDTLIDGMQDGVLVLDAEYRVVDYNPAAGTILGAKLRNKSVAQLFPNRSDLEPHLEAETASETELVLSTTEGARTYEVHMTPLYDYQKALAGFLLRLHDVTQRRLVEQAVRQYARELEQRNAELEASNAELDAFAHTVAHDLKNPLSVLIGFSTLLEARWDKLSPDRISDNLRRITYTGSKMTNIIDELLLLASVRKMEDVKTQPLDMGRIVEEAQGRLTGMVEKYQGEFILPKTWPAALGYAPWVEEVWTNYISNALKYGGRPESGLSPRVELGFEPPNGQTSDAQLCFWVRDNGPGLTEEQRARLFTQFTRLHRVRAEGHGLGLSIVQRIVTKLGGEVGVESEWGQGSRFWFTLPYAD